MSDYFLNKIYDSLLFNKPVPKKPIVEKKEIKKFEPLSNVYYRVLVEQITEDTDILMQQEPSGDVEEFKVSDELARKIKKDIKRETKIATDEGETTINEVLATVLTNKGWKENNPEYVSVLQRVITAFDSEDVLSEQIAKYSKLTAQTNNPLEVNVIQKPKNVQTLQNILPEWFNNFFVNSNGLPVANQIWNIDFSAKGGTKVGKLELLLTLISSGKKGTVGDIHFDGYGEVEVKGSGARMGGDAFAPSRTPDELNKILGGDSDALFKKTSEKYKRDLIAYLDRNMSSKIKKQEDIIPLQKTKQDILSARSYQEIVDDLVTLIKPYVGKSGREIFGKAPFIKVVNKVISDLQKFIERSKTPETGGFNESVNSFFSAYKDLTDDQLIDGIVATRNYTVQGVVPALRGAIQSIFSKEKANLLSEQGLTPSMRRLIGAIHMTLYYYVQKFKGILFANDVNRNVVYFAFNEGSSLEENIISCYKFLNTFNAEIGLSLDKRSASAGIELKI